MKRTVYMKRAIAVAAASPMRPFGTVIVHRGTGEVLGEGVNKTQENPILHAEIDAINRCAQIVPGVVWEELELYTTAEPCPMCQCAIEFARIATVYFGTSSRWLQAHRWRQIDILADEINRRTSWSRTRLVGGVLQAECNALFENARPTINLESC